MTLSANGQYRVTRIKRGNPHTVYLGWVQGTTDSWDFSATVTTKAEALARELDQCRRERGVLNIGHTDDNLPNNVKLDRITTALRTWQSANGRGGRAARAGS